MANNLVVCGGTFDHFHKGHEVFLSHALSLCGKLIVGLTSDDYVRNSKLKTQNSKLIENYETRRKNLEEFLLQRKVQDRVGIVKINNLFGPTLDKTLSIDAIVVSNDTKKGAEIINQKRKELGLKDLNILVVPSVYAEDGSLISSARIRNGEINRMGRLCVNPAWLKTDLILPENLREEFQKPFGELLTDEKDLFANEDSLVITVGDVTTRKFNGISAKQNISVIDFKIARKETFSSLADLGFSGSEKIIIADNPAGHITSDLFSKVLSIFKSDFDQTIVLEIAGEEDLAVLPLILGAPLNAIIYYGQPGDGLVRVVVTEKTKETTYGLVNKFEMLKWIRQAHHPEPAEG